MLLHTRTAISLHDHLISFASNCTRITLLICTLVRSFPATPLSIIGVDFLERRNMASGTVQTGATGLPVSQESWDQLTAYVPALAAEVQQYQAELDEAKKELMEAKAQASGTNFMTAKPNKPTMFLGNVGTVDSLCAHMES